MEYIAERAAVRAIEEMFTRIGLDTSDPIKLQTDFAVIRTMMRDEEHLEDMMFLRRFRKQMQGVSSKIGIGVIGLILTAVGGLIAFGLRAWLGIFPPPH